MKKTEVIKMDYTQKEIIQLIQGEKPVQVVPVWEMKNIDHETRVKEKRVSQEYAPPKVVGDTKKERIGYLFDKIAKGEYTRNYHASLVSSVYPIKPSTTKTELSDLKNQSFKGSKYAPYWPEKWVGYMVIEVNKIFSLKKLV